jgi:hypothetical protein
MFSKERKKTILFSIRTKIAKENKVNPWHTHCSLYQKNASVTKERPMEEMDIRQQFHLLQKELESAGSRTEELRLNLIAAIDALKIEVEVLRRFMEQHYQDFSRRYGALREEVIQQFDPEWVERARREKSSRVKETGGM